MFRWQTLEICARHRLFVSRICLNVVIPPVQEEDCIMSSDQGWLRREFERAERRSADVPQRARPVVVKGSLRNGGSTRQGNPQPAPSQTDRSVN